MSPEDALDGAAPDGAAPDGAAPDGEAKDGPEGPDDLRKIFEVWMDSEMKAMIAVFYARNPGVVETLDGLAKRLGTTPEALREHVEGHIRLGLLKERKLGGKTVLVFDRERRSDFESMIEKKIRERMGGDA